MRIFIAALIPDQTRSRLVKYVNSLKQNVKGVKWEMPEKLHVTLKFLGNVDEFRISEISDLLNKLVANQSPFNFCISEFGGFPHLRSPKVLYVGLSENKKFSEFQTILDQELSNLGFEKEDRKFIPHITIGRIKKRVSIKETPDIGLTNFKIAEIGLIKSELYPTGSIHTPIEIFNLSN